MSQLEKHWCEYKNYHLFISSLFQGCVHTGLLSGVAEIQKEHDFCSLHYIMTDRVILAVNTWNKSMLSIKFHTRRKQWIMFSV